MGRVVRREQPSIRFVVAREELSRKPGSLSPPLNAGCGGRGMCSGKRGAWSGTPGRREASGKGRRRTEGGLGGKGGLPGAVWENKCPCVEEHCTRGKRTPGMGRAIYPALGRARESQYGKRGEDCAGNDGRTPSARMLLSAVDGGQKAQVLSQGRSGVWRFRRVQGNFTLCLGIVVNRRRVRNEN